jgi:hypothetical protein
MGSGAIEPGVPGMTEPAREGVPPSCRALRFLSRSSSKSRSLTACARKAVTTSLVNLLGLVVGVFVPSDTGVRILLAVESEPCIC